MDCQISLEQEWTTFTGMIFNSVCFSHIFDQGSKQCMKTVSSSLLSLLSLTLDSSKPVMWMRWCRWFSGSTVRYIHPSKYFCFLTSFTLQFTKRNPSHCSVTEKLHIITLANAHTLALQVAMFTLHLGHATFLLTEPVISAMTTGAATHVVTSQVKYLLGMKMPYISGPLGFFHVSPVKEMGYFIS